MAFPRQEYWSRLPFSSSGDLPGPGIDLASPAWQEDSFFFLAGGFFTTKLPGKPQHDAGTCLLDIKSFTTTARAKIKTVLMPTHGGSLSWSQGLETPPIIGIPCIKKREEGDYELNTYSVPGLMPVLYCLLYLLHLILALTHAPFVNTPFFFFFATPWGMQHLGSLTRDWTCALQWKHRVLTTAPPEKSPFSVHSYLYFSSVVWKFAGNP